MYDRRGRERRQVAISKAAQEKGFYSEQTEKYLATQIEMPAGNAIDKILGGLRISADERHRLAFHIQSMKKRIPSARDRAERDRPELHERSTSGFRDRVMADLADQPDQLAEGLRIVDKFSEEYRGQFIPEGVERIRTPSNNPFITQLIMEMMWRVEFTDGPQFFVTTDNPSFINTGLGLGNEESEMLFPLSSTHALHGSFQGMKNGFKFRKIRQSFVREINKRLVSKARRFVFYHAKTLWITDLIGR